MSISQPSLSAEFCLKRQKRMRQLLDELSLDCAVFVSRENVQYLTGFRPPRVLSAAVCLDIDGRCTLAAPNRRPDEVTCDESIAFEAQWHSTLRQEQTTVALETLVDYVGSLTGESMGVEGSVCCLPVVSSVGTSKHTLVDIDQDIWRMRRKKDPDELLMIRKAIECTEAMYAAARDLIEPGVSELDVYNHLCSVAVSVAGEPLTALGNDFQCNSPGGPPRNRKAHAGELYILDLGPAYRGYFADNCRTISVDGKPTQVQLDAASAISDVLQMVQESVRPGVSCRDVFARAQKMLDEFQPGAFNHHLGHGFGLFPHEAPHLNPRWDDIFEQGDTFTAEPGLYSEELRAGIRLEQDYLVTETGVELLTDFDLSL